VRKILVTAIAILMTISGASIAGASDFGCRVLLCFSNPAGPTAVAECVPTYNKLISEMSKGDFNWPTCEEAEASGSKAVPSQNQYELCPNGYAEVGGLALKNGDYKNAVNPAEWITEGDKKYLRWTYPVYLSSDNDGGRGNGQYVVCGIGASKNIPIAKVEEKNDKVRYILYENAIIYSDIVLAQKIRAAYIIDIYIDGKLYKRVPINL
jgi:hypothetical protein